MPDRSWMYRKPGEKTKSLEEFMKGVEEFLDFAYAHPTCVDRGRIRCPSSKCDFFNYKTREEVQICLLKYGFRSNYTRWTRHEESPIQKETSSSMDAENMHWEREMVMEAIGQEFDRSHSHSPNSESNKFYEMLQAADEPLWEGCKKHTKLSAITRLLYLKSEHKMTNRCIDDMLTFIKELLPESEKMPDSSYRIKAMMKNLGLSYQKIHACENDCVLFWEENSDMIACPTCHEPRFKPQSKDNGKQVPKKVLRYFPLIPRLQRLYLSSKTAKHMRWHSDMRYEVDKYGITRVNTKSKLKSNDPFVLATQALQVFYANPVSRTTKGWCSVITTKARNTYDIIEKEGEDSVAEEETFQEDETHVVQVIDDEEMDDGVLRDDAEIGEEVEITESSEEEREEEEDIDDSDSTSVSESDPEEDDF